MYLFNMAKNVLWPPEMYKKRRKMCTHIDVTNQNKQIYFSLC